MPCAARKVKVRVSEREKHKGKKQREHRGAGRTAGQDIHAMLEVLPVDGLYVPCALKRVCG